jgi:hypothetical protein
MYHCDIATLLMAEVLLAMYLLCASKFASDAFLWVVVFLWGVCRYPPPSLVVELWDRLGIAIHVYGYAGRQSRT